MLQLSLKFQNLRVSGTKIPLDFNRQDRTRNTISTIMEVAPLPPPPPPNTLIHVQWNPAFTFT